jgi:hypothetical protein
MRALGSEGTTLLELLVALLITGMALAGGYSAFASVADHSARADEATREAQRASAIRSAIARWLADARITGETTGTAFRGLDGLYGEFADDELVFLTSAQTPMGEAGGLVRLYVDRDDETPEQGLVAEFSDSNGLGRAPLVLVSDAVALDIRYATTTTGGRRWLPSWVSSTVLPSAVEIGIGAGGETELHPLLEHPILVSIGGGR